jgi:hypothetical protein
LLLQSGKENKNRPANYRDKFLLKEIAMDKIKREIKLSFRNKLIEVIFRIKVISKA